MVSETYLLIYNTYMRMPLLGSGTSYRILELLLMVGFVGLIGCAASQTIEPNPIGKALLGESGSSRITVGPSVVRSCVKALSEAAFQAFPTA